MALLDDIKTQLDTDSVTGGATGWVCMLNYMPDSGDKIIAAYETGGFAPEKRFGAGNTTAQPTFQLILRADEWDYSEARTKASAAINSLDYVTISTQTIFVVGSPIALGKDAENRYMISINFEVKDVGGH